MCSAKGAPPPTISWTLDDEPIQRDSGHRSNQYTASDGSTISYMNVSSPQIIDGGVYRCLARNSVGSAEYQARINVRGACPTSTYQNRVCEIFLGLLPGHPLSSYLSITTHYFLFFMSQLTTNLHCPIIFFFVSPTFVF